MIFRRMYARVSTPCHAHFCAMACAVAVASCSGPGPVDASDPVGDGAFGEQFNPSIDFAPCPDDSDFECGTLRVPADYDDPHGAKLELAAIRAKAKGNRIGSLFVNFGGPGGGDHDAVLFLGNTRLAPLRERFDIIAFDPRGTSLSQPTVSCEYAPVPEPAPGDSAARAAYLDENAHRFAQACLAQTGQVVTKLGTNNVARDIDLFRAALGEKTLTFYGVSYGTEVGAVYASLFPKRVRAMVLDGGIWDTFSDYTIEAYEDEAAASELTLAHVDQLCRNDPSCPLHDTGLIAGLDQFMAQLRQAPVVSPDGTLTLRESDAGGAVYALLFNDRTRWQKLPAFVAAGLGGNYDPWFDYVQPPESVGIDPFLADYAAILCTDLGSRRPATEFLPELESIEALYPRVGRYAELEVLMRTCQAWPHADLPVLANVADKVKTPILLVGNDFDPATPITWTHHLAHTLGMEASLVRYEGGGHTASSFATQGVPCIDQLAHSYLFNLDVPPSGTSCPALPVTFLSTLP